MALALQDLGHALKLQPEVPGAFLWIGIAEAWTAQAAQKSGGDASSGTARAEVGYGRAILLNRDYADAYFWRGVHRARQAAPGGSDREEQTL